MAETVLQMRIPSQAVEDSVKTGIEQRVENFITSYQTSHPGAYKDQRATNLFRDLDQGRFWGVLHAVDGVAPKSYTWREFHDRPKKDEESRKIAREWSARNLTESEKQEVLSLVTDMAVTVPLEGGWPGLQRGHSILYRDIVENPGSIFAKAIDEKTEKRLNNGRFWEELGFSIGYSDHGYAQYVVEQVLTDNNKDLDPNYTPKGIKIFNRNNRNLSGKNVQLDLRQLSNEALDNYEVFIKTLHRRKNALGVTQNDLENLVTPYIVEVVSTTEDWDLRGVPRFGRNTSRNFITRLNDDIIGKYVKDSYDVRTALAKRVGGEMLGMDADLQFVTEILHAVPNGEDIFEKALKQTVFPVSSATQLIRKFHAEGVKFPPYPL